MWTLKLHFFLSNQSAHAFKHDILNCYRQNNFLPAVSAFYPYPEAHERKAIFTFHDFYIFYISLSHHWITMIYIIGEVLHLNILKQWSVTLYLKCIYFLFIYNFTVHYSK